MLGHQHLFPDDVKQTAATTGLVASRPRRRRAASNSGKMITDHFVQLQGNKIWMDLLEEKQIIVL